MKLSLLTPMFCSFGLLLTHAQAPPRDATSGSDDPGPVTTASTPYTVVQRGPNSRIWQRVTWITNNLTGTVRRKTNSYTELKTGMAHLVDGQWVDSTDQIVVTPTGAQATNAQFQVTFLGNINSAGAVSLTTPDGKRLTSNILGLSYWDTGSDDSIFFADIKDSVGQRLPSGREAIFPDAFTGCLADVLYVNSVSGFEQLVILRQQLPSPTLWNMNPATTMLQVITEFSSDTPSPRIINTDTSAGPDDHLDFGIMQMPQGYAFALGSEANKIPVTKKWLLLDGRVCLVEQVPLPAILPSLRTLPPRPTTGSIQTPADSSVHRVAGRLTLPKRKMARKDTPSLKLADKAPDSKGFAMDYTLTGSQTNLVFQSDTTYYIPDGASVQLCGSNVFEGGTVIKYGTNATINIWPTATTPTVSFYGSPYRPTVFTSKDDSSAGDPVGTNAPSGYYASPALYIAGISPQVPNLTSVRFAFAKQGLSLGGVSANVSDAQFINCQQGVSAGGSTLHMRNALFANTITNIAMQGSVTASAENATFSTSSYLATGPSGSAGTSLSLTNCIMANVTNLIAGVLTTNADYNAFYQTTSFGTHIAPALSSSPFQTVGAGSAYLAADSPYRNAGTSAIDTNLLADLAKKTTYPPLVYTGTRFTNAITLFPQAQRDSDNIDLGYHYDPLDWALGNTRATNGAAITIMPGTAIAGFATNLTFSMDLGASATVSCQGTPTAPCWIVSYNTVQEQSSSTWNEARYGVFLEDFDMSPAGALNFRFTSFSSLVWNVYHAYLGTVVANLQDCQLHAGLLVSYPTSINLSNCLLERLGMEFDPGDGTHCVIRNNTFFGGTFYSFPSVTNNMVYDNLFDHTALPSTFSGEGYIGGFNAYVTNCDRLSPSKATDIILPASPAYQTGPLGSYYQLISSVLFNADTSTTAAQVGLFHYTTITNLVGGYEIKETNSVLDIGLHYVATDANGNPIDTDGDGIPDYLEDANGNGALDSGETDWTSATDLGLKVLITRPRNGSTIP